MNYISIVVIAIGLAMDAFAVAVTSGVLLKKNIVRNSIKIALFFGFFQGIMPLLGWFVGLQFKDYIVSFDHWVAFFFLGFIGLKMIYDNIKESSDDNKEYDSLNNKVLLVLAIATSIDALIVGLSFAFLEVSIIISILTIAIITFIISFLGVLIGKKFGLLLKGKAEVFGGFILIFIGFKILIDHTQILYVFK